MVTCPDWVSALDRAVLQQALDTTDAPWVNLSDHMVMFTRRYASDTAAVQAVLTVLEVGAQVLQGRRDRQTAETLRVTAETWRDDLIVWANPRRPSGTSARGICDRRHRRAASLFLVAAAPGTRPSGTDTARTTTSGA